MQQFIGGYIDQHQQVLSQLAACAPDIERVAQHCVAAIARGNKLLLCGNGGSAADAQHMAAELVGRFVSDRPALAAIALTTDTSALTAIANDYGYENWLAKALEFHAKENDVVVLISSSGNSPNVVAAAKYARECNLPVVTFTGFSPENNLKAEGDINFWLVSKAYNIIECTHMIWMTLVVDMLVGNAEYSAS